MGSDFYKRQLADLRARLAREREAKKHDNEYYSNLIKNSSSPSSKEIYRKSKASAAASHDREIECLKNTIESCKVSVERERKNK